MRPVVLIDNLDSFSFNLVEAFERLGARVTVLRNAVSAATALEMASQLDALIVLSPGPGRPENAGCCIELISRAKGSIPLLGVCLGHQAIALEAGGQVCRAPTPVHGKMSRIDHDGRGPLREVERPLAIGRYHSLGVRDLPARLHVHADIDGLAMAMSDPLARQTGLQFHPESILTRSGDRILANILEDC